MSFGVLDGLVKAAAGLVVIVVVVRATLRWLRFPDRFMDDGAGTVDPSPTADGLAPPMPQPGNDEAVGEDER